MLFGATIAGDPAITGDGLDSNGVEWIKIETLSKENATPFVLISCQKPDCGADIYTE